MVKIVGIGGSLRPDSYSQKALAIATQRIETCGATVEILDLRTMTLPFGDGGGDSRANCGRPSRESL